MAGTMYHYNPSGPAAMIFLVCYLITSLLHTWQMARARTWFMIPFIIGGYFEVVGYLGRFISSRETPDWTKGPYIMQAVLLLVAPAFFAASIYMLLARIITLVDGQKYAVVRVTWLTKIFVAGDVMSFFLQGAGGGILGGANGDDKKLKMGRNLILAGLFVQLFWFGFFVAASFIFQARIRKHPTMRSKDDSIPWKKHLHILYASSVLIMIRSIFRVIEYIQGNDGYLLSHEVFLYIFDSILMLGVMVIYNIWHPIGVIALLRQLTMGSRRRLDGDVPLTPSAQR